MALKEELQSLSKWQTHTSYSGLGIIGAKILNAYRFQTHGEEGPGHVRTATPQGKQAPTAGAAPLTSPNGKADSVLLDWSSLRKKEKFGIVCLITWLLNVDS